jgi:transposase
MCNANDAVIVTINTPNTKAEANSPHLYCCLYMFINWVQWSLIASEHACNQPLYGRNYSYHMTARQDAPQKSKVQSLRQSGTLNPGAKKVQDQMFLEEKFFDPQDLIQVKYEMLRRVRKDKVPIRRAASSFGFSRPAFYKAQRDFTHQGLAGLIPRRRGPKGGHKLTREMVAFAEQSRLQEPALAIAELVRQIQKKFSVQVHRRTLERALVAAKKKRRSP